MMCTSLKPSDIVQNYSIRIATCYFPIDLMTEKVGEYIENVDGRLISFSVYESNIVDTTQKVAFITDSCGRITKIANVHEPKYLTRDYLTEFQNLWERWDTLSLIDEDSFASQIILLISDYVMECIATSSF